MKNTCVNGCCDIFIDAYSCTYYNDNKDWSTENQRNRKIFKSGVFMYDQVKNKVLLVQSRGKYWGCPKGTIDDNESIENGAIRELLEETGVHVDVTDFLKSEVIDGKAKYFFVKKNECDVSIQNHIENNDANGITWINVDCLVKEITNRTMKINTHLRILLYRFLNISIDRY
jgi:bis(5'-nucleosidyl)-tetraphosphatase